jgi:hypothetical protein
VAQVVVDDEETPVLYTLIFAGLAVLLVVAFFVQRQRR